MDQLQAIMEKYYERFPFNGNLIFVDTETTGTSKNARIIEIGAIAALFDGNKVKLETFAELINPGMVVSNYIVELTKITNQALQKARGDEVYSDFRDWVVKMDAKRIVAHNSVFDKRMIEANMARVGIDPTSFLPQFLCTMRLAQRTLTDVANDKLGTICEHFGFQNKAAHRALSDTEGCAYVYCRMMMLL